MKRSTLMNKQNISFFFKKIRNINLYLRNIKAKKYFIYLNNIIQSISIEKKFTIIYDWIKRRVKGAKYITEMNDICHK